jgi:hypothetical protein
LTELDGERVEMYGSVAADPGTATRRLIAQSTRINLVFMYPSCEAWAARRRASTFERARLPLSSAIILASRQGCKWDPMFVFADVVEVRKTRC